MNPKANWYVRAAAMLAKQWQDGATIEGVSVVDTILPLMDRILCDNGHEKNHPLRAAAYLHSVCHGVSIEEENRRMEIIRADFPKATHDIIAAFNSREKYLSDREAEITQRVVGIHLGPEVKVARDIVRVMITQRRAPEGMLGLARLHDAYSATMQRLVSEKMWLCLEQAFPEGSITKRQPMMLQLGFC